MATLMMGLDDEIRTAGGFPGRGRDTHCSVAADEWRGDDAGVAGADEAGVEGRPGSARVGREQAPTHDPGGEGGADVHDLRLRTERGRDGPHDGGGQPGSPWRRQLRRTCLSLPPGGGDLLLPVPLGSQLARPEQRCRPGPDRRFVERDPACRHVAAPPRARPDRHRPGAGPGGARGRARDPAAGQHGAGRRPRPGARLRRRRPHCHRVARDGDQPKPRPGRRRQRQPRQPVIGVRSYGSDPSLVARLTHAQVRGTQERGVIATAKHFPGHGDTDVDSHTGLPIINHTLEELAAVDFPPFRAASTRGWTR